MTANKKKNHNPKVASATKEEKSESEIKHKEVSAQDTKSGTLDVVEQAKKELEKIEAAQSKAATTSNKASFPWGVFLGAVILTCAAFLIGSKVWEMITVSRLQAKLPEIIKPLGGGLDIADISKPKNKSGVYSFEIRFADYEDEPFESYITRDGKLFFASGYNVEEILAEAESMNANTQVTATCEDLNKTEKPQLDVYVSSDCGHCQNAEVYMASAVEQVPALGEQIVLHYAGTINEDGTVRSFLGSNEAGEENLRQVCLREEQHDVFWPYIACKADGGTTDSCLQTVGANANTLKACMDDESRGIAAITADIDAANSLSVTGTPSFFVNNEQSVSDIDFGGRVADSYKQIICCASSEQPDFCATTLE